MGRRVVGALLCFAFWFCQMLGLLHRIAHPEHVPWAHQESLLVQPQTDDNFFARLFSGHVSDHDCNAFDHASYCDSLPSVAALVLPLAFFRFVLLALAGLAVARWHAQFQARGPPYLL